MAAVIEAEGLTKRYGRHPGLLDLDLTVLAGEVFGYLGPNGAGKTTTIRLFLDLVRPTRGRVRVLGAEPRRGVGERRRIGYLPGDQVLTGRDTGRDLLRFLGDARGGVPRDRIEELAGRLGVDLSRSVRSLSRGNRQKIGLVQAFMHQPDLLVLDEPTSGLDPLVQQEFLAMIGEVRASGRTVFMSSHVLAEVQQVADRVGIVRDGRLVAVDQVAELGGRMLRTVEIRFTEPVPVDGFTGLPGVHDVLAEGPLLRCRVDGPLDPLVKAAARFTVVDLVATEPDLEQVFLSYYHEGGGEHGAA
ncbi:MAG: ABC transporter ATP-binding protein [Actinomycetales bacterium]|nr:ABC transporter ATP-binding protein [Actinomycetales bacterium]